ncbi:hypothetical protein [Devosia riboflavina]|nr:hypothetical protein [Devosia riboflavina]
MKRTSLLGGALVAAAMTLISVGGSVAHPAMAALPPPSYAQATFATPTPPSSPDVILAVSDLVDLERTIKATSKEERDKFKLDSARPGMLDRV